MARNATLWNVAAIKRQIAKATVFLGMGEKVAFGICDKVCKCKKGLKMFIKSCGRHVAIVWELPADIVARIIPA